MWIYIAPLLRYLTFKTLIRITQFTCKLYRTCLYLVSIHQMAHPQTEVPDIYFRPTTHLSTPKGWKAELAWLADLHKWSPVSRRSSAGHRKFACQRPTFYHCATQPTIYDICSYSMSLLFTQSIIVAFCLPQVLVTSILPSSLICKRI